MATDLKRLKQHFKAYEPTLKELERKYQVSTPNARKENAGPIINSSWDRGIQRQGPRAPCSTPHDAHQKTCSEPSFRSPWSILVYIVLLSVPRLSGALVPLISLVVVLPSMFTLVAHS